MNCSSVLKACRIRPKYMLLKHIRVIVGRMIGFK